MPPPRMYTYDHIFRSCQHPLLTRARHDSDTCLRLLPLPTNLDRRLLPALLQILASEDGHGICFSNWSTSQISQLDQVPQPIDTVPALNESLLALSKHFFNRIDNKRSTSMPSPQTLKPTPPLSGYFRNDVTNLVSSPRYPPLSFSPSGSVMSHLHVLKGGLVSDSRHSHGLTRDSPLVERQRRTWQ